MASNKVSYASLKLKNDKDTISFQFNDSVIEIIKYLPITDKNDLVAVTLQKSFEDGIYNPLKLDMYFHLNLIYLMTNITFTDKQRENEEKLYDTLKSSGLLAEFLKHVDEAEYNELYDYLQEALEEYKQYNYSFAGIISKFINDLPKNANAAMEIVNNFDPNKFSEVVKFAEAANGGRPISELIKM